MTRAGAASWGIVGGGLLGLTLALRLAEAGHEVTVFEAEDRLGGLASAWRLGEVVWDRHYHVILHSDVALRGLLDELGLEAEIEWVKARTGCFAGGRLYSVSSALEFLRLPVLPLVDKLRLGATVLYASTIGDGRRLEGILVEDWLRRWSGGRAFERFWLPLLRSKLGENYRVTSAAFIQAVVKRLYGARRGGSKTEQFGYVPGGYRRVLERLDEVLRDRGVRVCTDCRLEQAARHDRSVRLRLQGGDEREFDRVALTMPAPIVPAVAPGLGAEESRRLRSVRYQGIVCASLLLERPLADYYITNLLAEELPFSAVIEMSALVDRDQFGGRSLVYLPRYLAEGDATFDLPDDRIRAAFLEGLGRMYPHFDPGQVLTMRLSRVRRVLALSTLGYSDHVPPFETSIPGLFVVNSSQIVNGTLNVDETVQLADRAMPVLLS